MKWPLGKNENEDLREKIKNERAGKCIKNGEKGLINASFWATKLCRGKGKLHQNGKEGLQNTFFEDSPRPPQLYLPEKKWCGWMIKSTIYTPASILLKSKIVFFLPRTIRFI